MALKWNDLKKHQMETNKCSSVRFALVIDNTMVVSNTKSKSNLDCSIIKINELFENDQNKQTIMTSFLFVRSSDTGRPA